MAKALTTFEDLMSTIRESLSELYDERTELINSNSKSDEIESLREELSDCEMRLENAEKEAEIKGNLYSTRIDAGYGEVVCYTDNLKLHLIMEELKQKMEYDSKGSLSLSLA